MAPTIFIPLALVSVCVVCVCVFVCEGRGDINFLFTSIIAKSCSLGQFDWILIVQEPPELSTNFPTLPNRGMEENERVSRKFRNFREFSCFIAHLQTKTQINVGARRKNEHCWFHPCSSCNKIKKHFGSTSTSISYILYNLESSVGIMGRDYSILKGQCSQTGFISFYCFIRGQTLTVRLQSRSGRLYILDYTVLQDGKSRSIRIVKSGRLEQSSAGRL